MLSAILLKVAAVFSVLMMQRCYSLQMVGSCTFQEYLEQARECTTAFIWELQTNKTVACSTIYQRMINCTKDFVRECVRGHLEESKIEALLIQATNQLRTKDFYCKDGLFSAPNLTDAQKETIPCKEQYYSGVRGCGETFQTKFRSNRADQALCSEFAKAKQCLRTMVTQHCELDDDSRELLDSAFDDYNPFCNISTPTQDEEDNSPQADNAWLLNPLTNEEELDAVGQCSITAQLNRTRKCITVFVRSLQNDPQGNCSVKYSAMQDCIVCMLRSCLTGYGITSESAIQVEIENARNQTNPEEFYCRGLLEAPKVDSDNEGLNCDSTFFEQEVRCMKDFNETFTANASDSSLCRKFATAKQCLRDLITNNCSGYSRNSSLEFALVFDEFNPFCPGSKDPAEDGSISTDQEDFNDPCLTEAVASSLQRSPGIGITHESLPLLVILLTYLTTEVTRSLP